MRELLVLDVPLGPGEDPISIVQDALLCEALNAIGSVLKGPSLELRLDAAKEVIDLYGRSKTRMKESQEAGGNSLTQINFNLSYLPRAAEGLKDLLTRAEAGVEGIPLKVVSPPPTLLPTSKGLPTP